MSNQLTPMQEFITALTENGLISINQTLIDGALKKEQQVIEEAYNYGFSTAKNAFNNTKFKQNEK